MFNTAQHEEKIKTEVAAITSEQVALDLQDVSRRWGGFMLDRAAAQTASLDTFMVRYPERTDQQNRYVVEQMALVTADIVRANHYIGGRHVVESALRCEAIMRLAQRANEPRIVEADGDAETAAVVRAPE